MTDNEKMDSRVLGGAGWMLLMKLGMRAISLVSILILARLLVPGDFGLVAMGTSIVALVELLRAFSFDIVLIQRADAQPAHYNSVWTLNLLFGAVMAGALYGLSGPAAVFYNDVRLASVIEVLALSVLVSSFENVGVVNFRKDFQFRSEFGFMLGKKVIGFLITVPLAFAFRSYWALVAGIVGSSLGGVILSYAMQSYRPAVNLSAVRDILSFSIWMLFNNTLFFLRGRSIDFIVGRLVGAQGLGTLTLAHEISEVFTSELMQPINRALLPGYAKLAGSLNSIRESYIDVVGAIAIFIVPAGIGLALVADDLVPLALGEQWLAAATPIKVLSIHGILVGLQSVNGTVYLALGRARLVTVLAAISVGIALPLLLVLTSAMGLVGACYGLLFAVLTMMPINVFVIRKEISLDLFRLAAVIARPIAGSIVMIAVCIWILNSLPAQTSLDHVLRLAATIAGGIVAYGASIPLMWLLAGKPAGVEHYIFSRLFGRPAAS